MTLELKSLLQKDPRHFTQTDIEELQNKARTLHVTADRLEQFLGYAIETSGYHWNFPKYSRGILLDIEKAAQIAERDVTRIKGGDPK